MPLTEEQREEIRRLLEKEVGKLERSIRISGKSAKPVRLDQQSVGRLSRMDAEELGVCANCGGEIAFGRLEVFPETEVCGGCG